MNFTGLGHTPSTAGTFRRKLRKNSGKTPETLSELFLEFPSRVRLGSPKPYNSRHLKAPERFQNSLPPKYGWGRLFFQKWFRRGPLSPVRVHPLLPRKHMISRTLDWTCKRIDMGSKRGAPEQLKSRYV